MKPPYARSVAIIGLFPVLWLCCAASYGQEIPDIKKMQETLGDLARQHECPGFVKTMVPSDGTMLAPGLCRAMREFIGFEYTASAGPIRKQPITRHSLVGLQTVKKMK